MSQLKTIYPVVLRPKFMEKLPSGDSYDKPFLDFTVELNTKNRNVLHFSRIDLVLQTMALRVEDDFINLCFDFATRLMALLDSNITKVHPLFKRQSGAFPISNKSINTPKVPLLHGDAEKMATDFTPWRTVDALTPSKMIYIAALRVSAIALEVSYVCLSSANKKERQALNSFSEAVGVTLKNFQNAQVTLHLIRSSNVFGSSNDILQQLF